MATQWDTDREFKCLNLSKYKPRLIREWEKNPRELIRFYVYEKSVEILHLRQPYEDADDEVIQIVSLPKEAFEVIAQDMKRILEEWSIEYVPREPNVLEDIIHTLLGGVKKYKLYTLERT